MKRSLIETYCDEIKSMENHTQQSSIIIPSLRQASSIGTVLLHSLSKTNHKSIYLQCLLCNNIGKHSSSSRSLLVAVASHGQSITIKQAKLDPILRQLVSTSMKQYYRAKGYKTVQWSTPTTTQDKRRVTKTIKLLSAVATDIEKAELINETVQYSHCSCFQITSSI